MRRKGAGGGGVITGVVGADARPNRGDGAAAVDGVDAVAAAVRRVPLARAACVREGFVAGV